MKFLLVILTNSHMFWMQNIPSFTTLDDCRKGAEIAVNLYVARREATETAEALCYDQNGEMQFYVSRQK